MYRDPDRLEASSKFVGRSNILTIKSKVVRGIKFLQSILFNVFKYQIESTITFQFTQSNNKIHPLLKTDISLSD